MSKKYKYVLVLPDGPCCLFDSMDDFLDLASEKTMNDYGILEYLIDDFMLFDLGRGKPSL